MKGKLNNSFNEINVMNKVKSKLNIKVVLFSYMKHSVVFDWLSSPRRIFCAQSGEAIALGQFLLAKPTHHRLVQLALTNCVTPKLHNGPYSMTPRHWYKSGASTQGGGRPRRSKPGIPSSDGALCRQQQII